VELRTIDGWLVNNLSTDYSLTVNNLMYFVLLRKGGIIFARHYT